MKHLIIVTLIGLALVMLASGVLAANLAIASQLDGNVMQSQYDVFVDKVTFVTTPTLSVAKQASPSPVEAGAQLTYTIRVTNTSNVTLTATITDILPSHVTPTGVLTWTPTITTPGGIWTKQVVVTVETSFSGLLTNKVQVTTEEGAMGMASVAVCANECVTYLPYVVKNHPPIYDFEGDFQGWGKQPLNEPPQPGQGVTLSTEVACRGNYSLRFDDLGPYSSETGTTQDVGVEYNAYNQKVTACVYLPLGAPSIPAVIYVQDCSDQWIQSDYVNLVPGKKYNRIFFDVPATGCYPYRTLGVHFTPGSYTGPVYIDYVVLEY